MNKFDVISNILTIPGATMVRVNRSNYVAIPTEDGVVKVSIGVALAEDTKNRKAFNFEAAAAEYKAWEATNALREAEKANKPIRAKGPNPEAQARRDELDAKLTALPAFTECTATDLKNKLEGQVAFTLTPMNVGQSARRLVEAGVLTVTSHEGDNKPYYTKA